MFFSSGKRITDVGWLAVLIAGAIVAYLCAGTDFAVFTVLVLFVSCALTGRCFNVFDARRVTIGTFWFVSYLAMIYFPAFFVYSDQEGPYRWRFLIAVQTVLITVPVGWWIANVYFHFKKDDIEKYFRQPIADVISRPRLQRRLRLLLLALAVLTVLYLLEVGTIPLFYLLRNPGEYLQLALLREDSFKLLDSPLKYLYALARGVGYPLLILVSFGAFMQYGKKKWGGIFLVSAVSGIFFASLSLAKTPVAIIFLMLAIFMYLFRGGGLSRKAVAAMLVLVLLFPVGVILGISSEGTTVAMALNAIGVRMFYGPSEEIYYYFEVFPSHVPYLYGRSIGKLSLLLGVPYFDTPNYVGLYESPDELESTNANAGFIADLNADFGMWGVIFGGVLAGFIMQAIQIYIVRRRKTVISLAVFAFLTLTFWYLNSASLAVVLASNGALLALILGRLLEGPSRSVLSEPMQAAYAGTPRLL